MLLSYRNRTAIYFHPFMFAFHALRCVKEVPNQEDAGCGSTLRLGRDSRSKGEVDMHGVDRHWNLQQIRGKRDADIFLPN
jgi:hypothetical protein